MAATKKPNTAKKEKAKIVSETKDKVLYNTGTVRTPKQLKAMKKNGKAVASKAKREKDGKFKGGKKKK
jgi:hypothetical protein